MGFTDARTFVRRVFEEFSEKNVTFMAAGLAYNAFLSLAPMLLLLFLILSLVGGGLEERIVAVAGEWLPGQIAGVVEQTFQEDPSTGGASVVGLVVLIWGALKIFRGLDTAFSEIYETVDDNSIVDKFRDGLVVLFALGLAVVATVGANAMFAAVADEIPYSGALPPLLLLGGLIVAFLPMYYVFPDTDVGVLDVLPGAAFAAVGWAAFQGVFQVYLQFSDPGAGSFAGGVLVVVIYLYFSSLVLLLGAVINAVSGSHSSGRPGGVGEGAESFETVRDESMDRDELLPYLRALTERVTTSYEPAGLGRRGSGLRPSPIGAVDVVEHLSEDDDEGDREWKVTLRWDVSDDAAAAVSRSLARGERAGAVRDDRPPAERGAERTEPSPSDRRTGRDERLRGEHRSERGEGDEREQRADDDESGRDRVESATIELPSD